MAAQQLEVIETGLPLRPRLLHPLASSNGGMPAMPRSLSGDQYGEHARASWSYTISARVRRSAVA